MSQMNINKHVAIDVTKVNAAMMFGITKISADPKSKHKQEKSKALAGIELLAKRPKNLGATLNWAKP